MPKYIEPNVNLNSFNCPHCGAHADQTWYTTGAIHIKEKGTPFIPDDENIENLKKRLERSQNDEEESFLRSIIKSFQNRQSGEKYFDKLSDWKSYNINVENLFISKCYSCNKIAIWLHNNLTYPVTNTEFEPNEDFESAIQADFLEAANIVNISPRGASALLRLCIQKLCLQVGEKGKNIDDDIASLVKKGLDERIQKALDIVRVIGNNAVHPGQIDLKDDRSTAIQLFDLVNLIADTMLSQPKRINDLYEKLPEGSLNAIKKRDGKN